MSRRDDEFDPWAWDRAQFNAGRSRLVIQRHGREVSLDRYGVSIDGRRLIRDDLNKTGADHGFDVRADGVVLYRSKAVAAIAEPEAGQPGQVTVLDASSPLDPRPAVASPQPTGADHRAHRPQQARDIALDGEEMDL
jgi:hypothetical protein